MSHIIELGTPAVTQEAQPEYGLEEVRGWSWVRMDGYVIPDRQRQVAISRGIPVGPGDYFCYLAAQKFNLSDITAESRIRWENRTYNIELQETIRSVGTVVLYKFKLIQTQDQKYIS